MFRTRPLVSLPLGASFRHQLNVALPFRQLAAASVPTTTSRLYATTGASATTISEAIKKDHSELTSYYNEIINSNDHDHQERFGNQFTWELARHSVAEELIVYPAFESHMGKEGHMMAEDDRKAHHRVKELLKEFQNLKPKQEDQYVPKLKELWQELAAHIEDEEANDLPKLEAALQKIEQQREGGMGQGISASESMAKKFGLTKAFVPSRSHPSAGENPYFESAMGMLAAPIDHIADIFRKFPDNTISPNPSTK
ncbi:hypothetical protein B0H66DRAFT_558801 [Apodospora peruviana]|uniref:Hemerythrin-like domain-containing protein n=1 Tax=Apodospora peruviana TaxID=516989 RepID=A0AAE0I5X6_9PEZI|nr:hypothetical protein B0H66DRAFT_558801 [Apodospora peruviana]